MLPRIEILLLIEVSDHVTWIQVTNILVRFIHVGILEQDTNSR